MYGIKLYYEGAADAVLFSFSVDGMMEETLFGGRIFYHNR
jgi:hypothetical protein